MLSEMGLIAQPAFISAIYVRELKLAARAVSLGMRVSVALTSMPIRRSVWDLVCRLGVIRS
jgi:hypothetical protein